MIEPKKVKNTPSHQLREEESIQENHARHMTTMKILNASSKAYQKISKSYFDIKTNIIAISQALQQTDYFPGISHGPAKTMLQIFCQANSSIADHCKEYSQQLHNLFLMYSEMAKQHHSKYKEDKNHLNHYLDKVKVLAKSDEADRYQRNQDKLKAAKTSYSKRSKQLNVFLSQTNEEASKIWEKNFVSFMSIFVKKYSQALQDAHSLLESYDSQQIILDDEDSDLHLSPKNSFKSISKHENFHERIDRVLSKARPGQDNKTPIVSLFMLNTKNKNEVNKLAYSSTNNTMQKLFGIGKLNSPTSASAKIAQNFNSQPFKKVEVDNDFSFFDNILSQKTKTQFLSSEPSSFSNFNLSSESTIQMEKIQKNTQFSLLDL